MAGRTAKWTLALLALMVLAPIPARADTFVSGAITTNTTWTAANSPYVLTGTVVVRTGATLTIEPGVDVKFGAFYYRLDVTDTASLVAIGTSAAPIEFTSTMDSAPGQWGSVRFTGSSSGTFDHVWMRYGGYGTAYHSNGLINVTDDATVSIDHGRFLQSDTSGLLANSTEEVSVSHSLFDGNGFGISVVGTSYGIISVTDSAITNNAAHGVFLSWSATPPQRSVFTYSDITQNGDHGFFMSVVSTVPSSAYPSATNSNIYENGDKQVYPVWTRSDTLGLWENNYWGQNTAGPLLCPLATQPWQYHLYYSDDFGYPQQGPIRSTTYSNGQNPPIKCAADSIPVDEFSATYVDNDAPLS